MSHYVVSFYIIIMEAKWVSAKWTDVSWVHHENSVLKAPTFKSSPHGSLTCINSFLKYLFFNKAFSNPLLNIEAPASALHTISCFLVFVFITNTSIPFLRLIYFVYYLLPLECIDCLRFRIMVCFVRCCVPST